MWRCVSWCQEFRCIHLLRPLVNPSFTFARNEGATNFTAVATKNTCTFILSFVVFISILNCVSKIAICILIVNRSFNFICPFFPGVFDACICKSNGRKSSPFPGPLYSDMYWFHVRGENVQFNCKWMWVSSLRRVPCYAWVISTILRTPPCWCEAWIKSALFHRTCAFSLTPKGFCNCMQNWHYGNAELASVPPHEKNANSSLVLFDFLSSLCIEKTYCFTNMPFLWASG